MQKRCNTIFSTRILRTQGQRSNEHAANSASPSYGSLDCIKPLHRPSSSQSRCSSDAVSTKPGWLLTVSRLQSNLPGTLPGWRVGGKHLVPEGPFSRVFAFLLIGQLRSVSRAGISNVDKLLEACSCDNLSSIYCL